MTATRTEALLPANPDAYVTVMQACRLTGVSRRTIYNWLHSGKLETVRTAGGSLRIRAGSLFRGTGNGAGSLPGTEVAPTSEGAATPLPRSHGKVAAAVVLLLALVAPVVARAQVGVSAQESRLAAATHTAIAGFAVGAFVDTSLTEYGIGKGLVREGNPLFAPAVRKGPVTAGVVKGSVDAAVAYTLLRLHQGHPVVTLLTAIGLAAGQVAVDVHNARTIRGR